MNIIRPTCRERFTAEDIDFVVSVLDADQSQTSILADLLTDPDARDLILDDDRLLRAVLENIHCLRISSRLYFYVLVRRVLREAGIQDRTLADYVAEMLTVFTSTHRTRNPLPDQASPMNYLVDMMTAMQTADARERFLIRAHLGNYALFLAGLFPGHVRNKTERRAAPNLGYYEGVGQTSYRIAGDHYLADQLELGPVFRTLSVQFHTTRLALNDLSDRLMWLEVEDQGLHQLIDHDRSDPSDGTGRS
jgi:hypothetical protein